MPLGWDRTLEQLHPTVGPLLQEHPGQPFLIVAKRVVLAVVAAPALGAEERCPQAHLGVQDHVAGLVDQT